MTTSTEQDTRELLVELLRVFYGKGWVSGTGGGISGPADDGGLLLAPTGVHKERIRPDEFFTVDPADGSIRTSPADPSLRPSECNSIFCLAVRERAAGSVVHSHALSAVRAGDLARDADHVAIRDLEMLKGIRGVGNRDVHLLPVIRNTPRESELVEQLTRVLDDPRYASTYAVIVADHGAYIWGADVWEAKRHTEVYHFLFEAVVARRDRQKELRPVSHHKDLSHLTKIDVVDVKAAVAADALTEADVFKRTYLGHGNQSSVFVFQGHPGPFKTHVHVTHDEIGYVLEGTGSVTVGGVTRPVKKGDVWVIPANTPHGGQFEDAPQVLFISSPIDDPDDQDRVWLD